MGSRQYLTNNIKLRIDDESFEALEALAKKGDRTVAAQIRRAIREHLQREHGAPSSSAPQFETVEIADA